MKKNRFILLLALLLMIVAAFFIIQNNAGSIRSSERNFAVKDTANITKIFIANRSGSAVTLEKQADRSWTVNKKKARADALKLLLDCVARVSVQTRVPKAAYNNIVKELSSTGIKVEIYLNNKTEPEKVYYVGGSTQDVLGTYMMLENSTVPFITEIPGFEGYLTPRYSPSERDWQETAIVSLKPEEIKSVTMLYNNHPDKSFSIEKSGNNYTVTSPVTNTPLSNPDTMKVKSYLAYFRSLNFEAWDRNFSDAQTDSLRQAVPASVLTVVAMNGSKTVLPMYPKPLTAASLARTDTAGRPLQYDLDRMYGFINNGSDLVTLQYYVFNKIFVSIDQFDLSKRTAAASAIH